MTAFTHQAHAQENFDSKAPDYQMKVDLDSGVYRHLKFRIGESYCCGFDIVTWPGHLAISGDMGTFVFARLEDMFEFFRGEPGRINPSYWSEKLQASDKNGGCREFSPDLFRTFIREWAWAHEEQFGADQEFREAVEVEVLARSHDGADAAYTAARDFEHNGESAFQDFWEVDCTEFTYCYLWCCYAIVWAIRQYDERAAKAGAA